MRSRGRSFAPLPSSVPVGPGRRSPRRPAGASPTSASIASRKQRASLGEPGEHRLVELGLGRQLQVLRLVRLYRRGIRVSEPTTNVSYGHTFSKQASGGKIAEVVQAHRLEVDHSPQSNEFLGDLVRHPWALAVDVSGERVRTWLKRQTARHRPLIAVLAMFGQQRSGPAPRAIRRDACVFVSFSTMVPSTASTIDRWMVSAPEESASDHRGAQSSPLRAPVVAASRKKHPNSGSSISVRSMSRMTSAGAGGAIGWLRTRGGDARTAGFVEIHPQRIPCCKARRRIAWVCRTVAGASRDASFPPLSRSSA